MRHLTLATFAILFLGMPVKADLAGADITGPTGGTTTGNQYDAWCGESRQDCKITFKNDRLVVGEGSGITKSQVEGVTKTHVCRHRSFGILECTSLDYTARLYDKEFLITYVSSGSDKRTALITFRNQGSSDKFERDLQIWMGSLLRGVGPSVKIN